MLLHVRTYDMSTWALISEEIILLVIHAGIMRPMANVEPKIW